MLRDVAQVVTFAQTSLGSARVLGQVMATSTDTGGVAAVAGVEGRVLVEARDLGRTFARAAQKQVRTYEFNGQRFVQTAGPTSFPPSPRLADLAVTVSPLTLGRQGTGRLVITVRNLGPGDAAWVFVNVVLPEAFRLPTSCRRLGEASDVAHFACHRGGLRAGDQSTLTLDVSVSGAFAGASAGSLGRPPWLVYLTPEMDDTGDARLPDPDETNNLATVVITVG